MKLTFTKQLAAVAVACLMAANVQAGTATWNDVSGNWDGVHWSPALGGDFNGDGAVDGDDFLIWQQNGANAADFAAWSGNFGTVGGGANVDALTAFGSSSQIPTGSIATIDNGSIVTGNSGGGTHVQKGGVLNISGGSSLIVTSSGPDVDGDWTKADGVINLDNGTLDRSGITGPVETGGFFMMGSWSSNPANPIRMNLTNGSTFKNNGVVTFGIDDDSPVGLDVKMSIGGFSSVDLTGGGTTASLPTGLDNDGVGVFGARDLSFVFGFDASGVNANEHVVDFTGAGTLVVDNGIQIATEDLFGQWALDNNRTYQQLWDAGILKYNGSNTGTFSENFVASGSNTGADYTLRSAVQWTGGNEAWDAATSPWEGASSAAAFTNGTQVPTGYGASISNGSTVIGNSGGGTHFQKGSVMNISGGSTLVITSSGPDVDGDWTKADGVINLNNGTLDRSGITGPVETGGFFMMGSWSSNPANPIRMNLSNGSVFKNNGVVTFGIDDDSPVGLDVKMSITGGSVVDLTGGGVTASLPTGLDNDGVGVFGARDLSFVFGFDASGVNSNTEVISLSDAGSKLIVDNGIQIATEDLFGIWALQNDVSYETLWNMGILQYQDANLGAFLDHFVVTGTPGGIDYTLTALAAGPLAAAVPEPASMLLIALGGLAMLGSRRRR